MNKTIITLLSICVVIIAIIVAVAIFNPNKQKKIENMETEVGEEEILDDCTDEYDGIEYQNMVKANAEEEEKTSPNCALITKKYYEKCGHTTNEYINLPQELVNLTQEEIQKKYSDYEIKSFASNEIVLYKEVDGECEEHYMIKNKNGFVTVYQILEDGSLKEIETTSISTEYLTETDKINMQEGIKVNGKQQLNQLIEDFE